MSQPQKPRVLVNEDVVFGTTPLSHIVAEAGCALVRTRPGRLSLDSFSEDLAPLALIILSLDPDPPRVLEVVAELRRQAWLDGVPILGTSSPGQLELDSRKLQMVGLNGLMDAGAPREHVRFRISQLAYKGAEGRRHERAPCCIPVDVEVDGEWTPAYATSLSAGGMGLACTRRIEPNTTIGLRFVLDDGQEAISATARTVRLQQSRRPDAAYEVGLFFHRLPEHDRATIGATVKDLLAAWDTVRSSSSLGPSTTDPAVESPLPASSEDRSPRPMSIAGTAPSDAARGSRRRRWPRAPLAFAALVIAGMALSPLAVRYVAEQRSAQALAESRTLGRAILAFYLDTGSWPVNDDGDPATGEISRLVGLPFRSIRTSSIPHGAGDAGGWVGHGDGGRAASIADQLIHNAREGLRPIYPTSATAPDPPGWNGPYLASVPLDPWGRPYVCNTRYLLGAEIGDVTADEANDHAVVCLSAGPDGQFETPFRDDTELSGPGGDDLGWLIQADHTP